MALVSAAISISMLNRRRSSMVSVSLQVPSASCCRISTARRRQAAALSRYSCPSSSMLIEKILLGEKLLLTN